MNRIVFNVPGTPVGKGRPRFARRGKFVATYTPEKTASYENLIKVKAMDAMRGCKPLEGALSAYIYLTVTPPASWSKKKQAQALNGEIQPTTKPDLDNVIKGIFDAMNEIVYLDDKQIISLLCVKRYGDTAFAQVQISDFVEAQA
jgi:Holliday junction resolvase RusA-like endonuclease